MAGHGWTTSMHQKGVGPIRGSPPHLFLMWVWRARQLVDLGAVSSGAGCLLPQCILCGFLICGVGIFFYRIAQNHTE